MKKLTFFALLAVWLTAAPAVNAQNAGTIVGQVRNQATMMVLNQAYVTVEGLNLSTLTDTRGNYSLSLPPGRYQLSVRYSGLDTAKRAAEVTSQQTTELNFDLTSEVYQLDRFVVTSIREGDALALQQQRHSSGMKTVVATDAYGAPADNPGELLQRLSGISVGYEQGEVNSLSVRGMGVSFAKLTVDGQSAATSFGNLQATGREFIVTELATNNLSQVELTKAPTPDQDADAIAGTINLITKRYFDAPGRKIILNATVSGITRDFDTSPNEARFGNYGRTALAFSDVYNVFGGKKNFGAAIDLNWSKVLRVSEKTGPQDAGTLSAAYVGFSGANPLTGLFSTSEWGGPIEKYTIGANFDYKLSESSFAYTRLAYTHQNRDISRYIVFNSPGPTAALGFLPGSTFENSTVLSSDIVSRALRSFRESENFTFAIGAEHTMFAKSGRLSVQGNFSRALSRNPFSTTLDARLAGIGFRIDRRNQPFYSPALVQTAGDSWSDPASYKAQTFSNTVTDGAPQNVVGAKSDYTHVLTTNIPAGFKVGVKYQNNSTSDRRRQDQLTWVGKDGVPNSADDSIVPMLGNVFRLGKAGYGPFPFMPLVRNIGELSAPTNFWAKTAAQAYSDLTGSMARKTEFGEESFAGYMQGNITLGKVKGLVGARAEKTTVTGDSWIRNATAAYGGNSVGGASLDPSVVAANRARAERSYVRKERSTSKYANIFPGAHIKWEAFDGFLVRGSYNRSITRPNIISMLPTANVDDVNQTVSIGNPELKPYLANNFDVSVERYFEPVGLISVGAFRKDISRYFRGFSDVVPPSGIDGDGSYAGYTRTTSRNIGSARIRGIELNVQQQFRNLPGFWKGFGAFANFTYLEALGDFGTATITRRLPNMSPRTGNLGLSYVGHGWQIRPLLNWTGKTYRGTSGALNYDSADRKWIDVKMQYAISRRYALELSVFNLTNAAESQLVSSDGRFPFVQIKPGTAYSVGFTARY